MLDAAIEAETGQGDGTACSLPPAAPKVLVFDSGLGGLTVYSDIRARGADADLVYVADDAVFPYGGLDEATLVRRVLAVMRALIETHDPKVVVIACNTASTLVLGPLRSSWPSVAFVGTVPAVKPAAAMSRSRLISVLATPGTVARDYTRDLVRAFAEDCTVTLVGAPRLASLAEAAMRGEPIPSGLVAAEALPAFVEEGERRTDVVVLACTHYPLLLPQLTATAPWSVTWIDPAAAIARRVSQVLGQAANPATVAPAANLRLAPAYFTSNTVPGEPLRAFLASRGLRWEPDAALGAVNDGRTAGR